MSLLPVYHIHHSRSHPHPPPPHDPARELNFFGCRQLSGAHLTTVLGQSPALQRLNVNGCWGLGTLHLPGAARRHAFSPASPPLPPHHCARRLDPTNQPTHPTTQPPACLELRSLDASGCRNLASLSSPSPRLSDLQAVACPRLATLTLAPARRMRRLLLTNCGALRDVHAAGLDAAAARQSEAAAAVRGRGGDPRRQSEAAEELLGVGLRARGAVSLSGCAALSPEGRARLAGLVA
jgi:hypothetical protein